MNIDGEMALFEKIQINPLYGVMLINYLTCKRMNVWKHISINLGVKTFALHFFSNYDSKDCKNTLLHNDQSVSSCVLIFITHFSPTLCVKVEDGE
jgi:hypothetical protein